MMSTQLKTENKVPIGKVFTPVSARLLLRKCACGNHTKTGGECEECAKKKSLLQRKLTIGASNDPLEQEADRVADQVMSMPLTSKINPTPPRIQRYSGQTTHESLDTAPPSVDRVLSSSGTPLEPSLRHDMEARFGHDFSQVRVHTGNAAEQSATDINARAYTIANHVVFNESQFEPNSFQGRKLIAHELSHVIQQTNNFEAVNIIQRVGECNGRNGYNCNGAKCTTPTGRQGKCIWGGISIGCNCRDTSSDEPGPSRVREMLPSWLLVLLSAAALAAIAACFASGVCEFGIVVAGLSTAAAAAVISILNAAGVRDSGSSGSDTA